MLFLLGDPVHDLVTQGLVTVNTELKDWVRQEECFVALATEVVEFDLLVEGFVVELFMASEYEFEECADIVEQKFVDFELFCIVVLFLHEG